MITLPYGTPHGPCIGWDCSGDGLDVVVLSHNSTPIIRNNNKISATKEKTVMLQLLEKLAIINPLKKLVGPPPDLVGSQVVKL